MMMPNGIIAIHRL